MKITFVNRVLTQALEVIYHPDIDEDDDSDYDHIATNCPSEMKITFINRVPTQAPESDDKEVIYHLDIDEDDDSDYD